MSRAKRSSKRKRLTKATAVPVLGAAGLSLSLVGSASASALPNADIPQSPNSTSNHRLVLGEEEMADVSLATFHLFDRETGTAGLMQLARGCGCGGCHGCGGGGCGHVGGIGVGCRACGAVGIGVGCRGCGCRGCGCGGCGGCAAVGVGLGLLGLGLVGGCGVGWGGCGWGGCCASWGVCRFC